MRLNLFPTVVGAWSLGRKPETDRALYNDLMQTYHQMKSDGGEIWNRNSHNIFDGSVPSASDLLSCAIPIIQRDLIGPNGRVSNLQGREVVRFNGTEIMPHSDEDECHMQAVYFPNGPELESGKPLLKQINVYGKNGFAICNPDWRSSGFGKKLMPWEECSKFWIKPHRGLLIAFDARAVHFQKPYTGEVPFMQILINISVENANGSV
jgi:hypothetical protein